MWPRHSRAILTVVLAVAALGLGVAAHAGPKFKVLHGFGSGQDGAGLWGSLARDSAGNLYGTTSGGGAYGYGTVFQLTPSANGQWKERILRSLRLNDPRGDDLTGTPIVDGAGNLYVTASDGGGPDKNGTVFELTPGSGGWNLHVLYRFQAGGGEQADAGVIMDKAGNLYGPGLELSPGPHGWKLKVLHKFPSYQGDGADPYAAPIIDAEGNLYGTTNHGGGSKQCDAGCGTAYELSPGPGGKWKERILHRFGAFRDDGTFPAGGALAIDAAGNLHGATARGGNRQGPVRWHGL